MWAVKTDAKLEKSFIPVLIYWNDNIIHSFIFLHVFIFSSFCICAHNLICLCFCSVLISLCFLFCSHPFVFVVLCFVASEISFPFCGFSTRQPICQSNPTLTTKQICKKAIMAEMDFWYRHHHQQHNTMFKLNSVSVATMCYFTPKNM